MWRTSLWGNNNNNICHLADAFIQSDLQSCVHTFYIWVVPGIEPTTLALQAPCSTNWATEGPQKDHKPLLQNCHKKAIRWFATAHGDKDRTFWRNVLWSDETKIELFGHNEHCYVWRKKGEACKPKKTIPTMKHGGGSIMLRGCFATGALHKIGGCTR